MHYPHGVGMETRFPVRLQPKPGCLRLFQHPDQRDVRETAFGVPASHVGVYAGKPSLVALVRSLPLYVVFFATIAFCISFPEIVLWLPKHMLPESVGCFKNPAATG